ncbi:MAG: Na/Pi cotransporter family protein [Bacteroidota bacterium]
MIHRLIGSLFSVLFCVAIFHSQVDENTFLNVHANPGPEKVEFSWSIDYEYYQGLDNEQIFIKYNTAINADRVTEALKDNREVKADIDFLYSNALSISETSYILEGLKGNEKYVFYIGHCPPDSNPKNASYSSKKEFKTDRAWGLTKLLILIGSLAFFIYGMKTMSEGLQQAAGDRLRKMLASITSNRVKGVLTGFGITSVVQSSSVTTVMTVSFVNAGLMTLRQSAGVMMGANIGTTITAWLVLILGFKVSISSYAFIILAFAGPLLFVKNETAKSWANALIGFCILFIGLSSLKDSVPELDRDSAIVQFFVDYKDVWFGPLMFVFLGALVTIIIQSSSAAMALTLAMVDKGVIPFEVGCAMVLGENIGTTVTAEIASLIANVHAKRSARIHSMFNIVGVTWMLLLFPIAKNAIGWFVGAWEGEPFDPANIEMAKTGIPLFHTGFNLINVLLLIWFVPQLVSLAERTVKSKGEADDEFRLEYINSGMMSSPELSILEAKKEVMKFGSIVRRQSGFVRDLLLETDKKKYKKTMKRVRKYEEITDNMEIEISDYLSKVSEGKLTSKSSNQVHNILSMISDLEDIGDIGYHMSVIIGKKNENKIYFNPKQRENLLNMFDKVDNSFKEMESNLKKDFSKVDLEKARQLESDLNSFRDELRKQHLKSTEKSEYHIQSGLIYNDLFSSLEKIGDHVMSISESMGGEVN